MSLHPGLHSWNTYVHWRLLHFQNEDEFPIVDEDEYLMVDLQNPDQGKILKLYSMYSNQYPMDDLQNPDEGKILEPYSMYSNQYLMVDLQNPNQGKIL